MVQGLHHRRSAGTGWRIVSPTEKTCKDCGRLKPIRAFNRSGVSRDGHQARCYECHKARYYEGQRERARLAYRTDAGWVRAALSAARRRAARDGVPFDLVEADVVIPATCPVLGVQLSIASRGMSSNAPTLDRINPALGYVRGNVAVISWLANKIKGNQTDPTVFERIAGYMRRRTP